ncbi:MAG TPA: alpha/beta hydrolase [Actinomycetota bacterium]|jgi:acetyl esterase|nr:alpha/beta hydrolase [Actinomycetota bacterium]
MGVHPQVQALLEELISSGRPSSMSLPLPDGRRNFDELFQSLSSSAEVERTEDRIVPGPAGEVRVRVYTPSGKPPLPVVVFFHGGGWVFGGIEAYDGLCRALASASRAVLVTVAFRLAPEHRFPAGLQDCYSVTEWVHANHAELRGDPARLAVAGDSSGANLAAAVALMARDRGGPPIAFLLLAYPAVDPEMASPSYRENGEDPFLSRAEMVWYWDQYLASGGDRKDPYAAPLHAENLEGLPPTHIVTAGFDVLRDEGEALAARLREAGVPVTLRRYDDMVHGFLIMGRYLDTARQGIEDVGRLLRQALATPVRA